MDSFSSETPLGNKAFTNIIVTPTLDEESLLSHGATDGNPPRLIILAAHYDSKYFEVIIRREMNTIQ